MILDKFLGERGVLSPWRDNTLFTGTDVVVQLDGSITSRQQYLKPWADEFLWDAIFTDKNLVAVGVAPGTGSTYPSTEHIWFITGSTIWAWDGVSAAPEIVGELLEEPTERCQWIRQGSTIWISSPGLGLYKYVVGSSVTVTKVSNVTPGKAFAVWQGLEIASGGGGVTPGSHRLYWSDPESVWPASTNYNDIGDEGSDITGAYILRNQLLVTKDDGSWWMITGQLPTSDNTEAEYQVRDVTKTNYAIASQHNALANDNAIVFSPDVGGFPMMYNGSQFAEYRHLVGTVSTSSSIIAGAGVGDVVFHSGSSGLMNQNGVWTKITVPTNSIGVLYQNPSNEQVFAFVTPPNTAESVAPELFTMRAEPLTDPAAVVKLDGALLASTVTFPEIINDGTEQVTCLYIFYRRIASAFNVSGFDIQVTPRRYPIVDGITTEPSPPASIDMSSDETVSYAAGRYVMIVNVAAEPAYSYEITISNIHGCAIERISTTPAPSGYSRK